MKNLSKNVRNFGVAVLALTLFSVSSAFALTPSINVQGMNGNDYQINVYGDANQAVTLYYHSNSNPLNYTNTNIGSTNSSGNMLYNLSLSALNMVPNDSIYIAVNGNTSNILALNNYSNNNYSGSNFNGDESSFYDGYFGGTSQVNPTYFPNQNQSQFQNNQNCNNQKVVQKKFIKKVMKKVSHKKMSHHR